MGNTGSFNRTRLYAEDTAQGVPPDKADKLRKMLAFLEDMQGPEDVVEGEICDVDLEEYH